MTIRWSLRIIKDREVYFVYHGWIGKGKVVLNAVLLRMDEASGRALSIERIAQEVE